MIDQTALTEVTARFLLLQQMVAVAVVRGATQLARAVQQAVRAAVLVPVKVVRLVVVRPTKQAQRAAQATALQALVRSLTVRPIAAAVAAVLALWVHQETAATVELTVSRARLLLTQVVVGVVQILQQGALPVRVAQAQVDRLERQAQQVQLTLEAVAVLVVLSVSQAVRVAQASSSFPILVLKGHQAALSRPLAATRSTRS